MSVALIAPPWFTVPPPGYGGTEAVVDSLARLLVARGHEVTVVATGGSRCAGRLRSPLIEPPDPSVLGDPWIEATHVLQAYAQIGDADIIHDHSGVVGATVAAVLSSRPPVLHTLHGPWTAQNRAFYRLVHDRLNLVAISETQRGHNTDVSYAGTVHNGVQLDEYPLGTEARGDELIYVGRANPGKNPAGAIRVARAAGRPLRMIVKRGEPPEVDYWHEHVEPLLGDDIEVLEGVEHQEKVAALQHAYAMVFPIRWPEPFGLVMVEAMACGTPVLACPSGAAVEIVCEGRSGFLCRTEEQMGAQVAAVAGLDPSDCRAWVAEHFSAEAMACRYEAVYAKVVRNAADAGGSDLMRKDHAKSAPTGSSS